MNKFETIGTFKPEFLIADAKFPFDVVTVKIAATSDKETTYVRGTVLAYDTTTESCAPIAEESTATKYAAYILAEDVTTSKTDAVVAQAYQTGKFIGNSLITNGSYELKDADVKALRDGGIYLTNGMN